MSTQSVAIFFSLGETLHTQHTLHGGLAVCSEESSRYDTHAGTRVYTPAVEKELEMQRNPGYTRIRVGFSTGNSGIVGRLTRVLKSGL